MSENAKGDFSRAKVKSVGEIDLMANYPKSKRDLKGRRDSKSEENCRKAREFGFDYFDGDRDCGYGGFNYNPKFWDVVVQDFAQHYKLAETARILDIGCAKGFMLFDFKRHFPKIDLWGIDISEYAISNAIPDIRKNLSVGTATNLPYEDNFFDLVISINTIHNLDKSDCAKALQEIDRVTRQHAFITVDAFRSEEEKERMYMWNLTALTIMSADEWRDFFRNNNYDYDYYWFIP